MEKWYFWLEHGRKSGASYFLFFFNGWDKGIPLVGQSVSGLKGFLTISLSNH